MLAVAVIMVSHRNILEQVLNNYCSSCIKKKKLSIITSHFLEKYKNHSLKQHYPLFGTDMSGHSKPWRGFSTKTHSSVLKGVAYMYHQLPVYLKYTGLEAPSMQYPARWDWYEARNLVNERVCISHKNGN